MHDYDIRILKAGGTLTMLSRCRLPSDLRAVAAGRKLCRAGETVEVWRGETCVFQNGGRPPRPAFRPQPPRLHTRLWS
jgi:hypothetical protein